MINTPPVIQVKNISVIFGKTVILKDISFSVNAGEFIYVTGPNGGGKTTLIKALLGLIPLKSGEVLLFNQLRKNFRDFYRIGYLPQKYSYINYLLPVTVKEVVALGLHSFKKPLKDSKDRVEKILEELKIDNLKDKLFSQLSGGEQQRTLLARGWVANPELIILDEPSTALDVNAKNLLLKLLEKTDTKKTVIFVTHNKNEIQVKNYQLLELNQTIQYLEKNNY